MSTRLLRCCHWLTAVGVLLLVLHGHTASAQCWGASAGGGSQYAGLREPNLNDPYERFLVMESARLRASFGVTSRVHMIDVKNAFADPGTGDVYFGRPMIELVRQQNPGNVEAGLRTILAHEFGHQIQFKMARLSHQPPPNPSPQNELQADCIAGIWMGITTKAKGPLDFNPWKPPTPLIKELQTSMILAAGIGDCNFFTPTHHGEPGSRRQAVNAGVDTATQSTQTITMRMLGVQPLNPGSEATFLFGESATFAWSWQVASKLYANEAYFYHRSPSGRVF